MPRQDREWTDRDMDRLRQMDERGVPATQIAEALIRTPDDIEERLRIVRVRAPGPGGAETGATTATPLDIGTPLEEGQPEIATRELRPSDASVQQASRPPGLGPKDVDPTEGQQDYMRQAERNAARTSDAMRQAGFGDDKGTEGT
ncbi:hypothetical protein [Sphingobium subterraneum]|uniref:Uncharacterized protein n=1 Tax=Sphingobium subterraneum TaxID=627688 RepID=A0A841IY69_9SPHN|nr:hypothetical protein [Sphingobium subterraneum]MBB6123344.1 hypothetical protein [Sphingobium subterraneum]